MKKVADSNGELIDGLYRDSTGCIVVNNPSKLAKYKSQVARDNEYRQLKDQVTELTNLVKLMMERNNG